MSPFLFQLAIDWVMTTPTAQKQSGIQLDDLGFADDLALLTHSQQQMQGKTSAMAANSAKLGLNIHRGKSKVLKVNTASETPITLADETLEDVDSFTYLRHERWDRC